MFLFNRFNRAPLYDSSAALLVIDMQPEFPAAWNRKTQGAIVREIQAARKVGQRIYVLEYSGGGDTHPTIRAALEGYPWVHFVVKSQDDGSFELMDEIEREGVGSPKRFTVTGINTDACVARTVHGLTEKLPKANYDLVRDACGSDSFFVKQGNDPWARFEGAPKNVKILERMAA